LADLNWLDKPYVKAWLDENPSVRKWLDNSERIQTRTSHGNYLYKFCQTVGEPPEALRRLRYISDKEKLAEFREKHGLTAAQDSGEGPLEDGGDVILDLLHDFIRHGRMLDYSLAENWRLKREEAAGTKTERRVIEVAKLSKHRREGFYYAVRSYFASLKKGQLPSDKSFKISEIPNRAPREEFEMEGDAGLKELDRIIMAAREPYRTLFSAAKYGLLGRSELAELGGRWEKIREALQQGKEEVRIDFAYRKSNELPYYTFLPAKIFTAFQNQAENPFVTNGKNAIAGNDLDRIWRSARKRAGIKKRVGINNIRDLMRTTATKAGTEASCVELMMGHTVDPLRYNQIYSDPAFVKAQWEKLRSFTDGQTQEWKKDVEALNQRLEKTETARRDDRRLMIDQFLADFHYSPRSRKQLGRQHGGDLANLTLEEMRELAEKAEPEFQAKKSRQKEPDGPPPIKVMPPGAEADKMIEQGWDPHLLQDGKWRLVWKYNSKPPPLPRRRTPAASRSRA
jgi:hypothetical protein